MVCESTRLRAVKLIVELKYSLELLVIMRAYCACGNKAEAGEDACTMCLDGVWDDMEMSDADPGL